VGRDVPDEEHLRDRGAAISGRRGPTQVAARCSALLVVNIVQCALSYPLC
jgi:hypothetical protein